MSIVNKRKTNEQYAQEIFAIHGDRIRNIEPYSGARTQIKHQCLHGHQWDAAPTNILKGRTCPYCSQKKKLTPDEYRRRVKELHGDRVVPIQDYVNRHTHILHRCNEGHEYMSIPAVVLRGTGCTKCSGRRQREHDEYVDYLSQRYGDKVQVLEPYVTVNTPILHQCQSGHQWKTRPSVLIRGWTVGGCLICANRNCRTHVEYVEELKRVHGDRIKAIGTYVNRNTRILHECSAGHQWEVTPSSVVIGGTACPYCDGQKLTDGQYAMSRASKLVRRRIYSFVKSRAKRDYRAKTVLGCSVTRYVKSILSAPDMENDIIVLAKLHDEVKALNKVMADCLKVAVDHIIPFSFADAMNPDELKIISKAANLRIITKTENNNRRNKITKQEFFDRTLFTDWHIEAMLKLTNTRRYCPDIDQWVEDRLNQSN